MNLKERLTKQYEAERTAGHAAVETDFKTKMDALEVVWRSLQRESSNGNQPTAHVRQKRVRGVTQAVDFATVDIQGIFTADDIVGKVAAMFPDREIKRQQITDSLWRLEQEDKVRVVVGGRGKRKGQYERIKPNSVAQELSQKHEELTM